MVPSVLLLDDGELEDIQRMLEELRVPLARIRGGAIVSGTPAPRDLLIATPRRIDAVVPPNAVSGSGPVRIVVVNEDSTGLRERLRRSGFDYLVRRPVHPEALRLMLLRSLYRGEEKRGEPRVAAGLDVSYRTGLRSRRAILADLSTKGCRLVSRTPVDSGRRIRVNLPEALETGDPIAVVGHVLRSNREERPGVGTVHIAAVLFDRISDDARQALELLVEDLSRGPATLRRGAERTPVPPNQERGKPISVRAGTAPKSTPKGGAQVPEESHASLAVEVSLESEGEGKERRIQPRAAYELTVPAFGKRALRVLVGRDLSIGGMRIERLPALEVGDRLHLAVYGSAEEAPFLVWGTVTRDDGDAGMGVVFDLLEPEIARRLERLVTSLPAVESLRDGETEAMGTVVSEILPE
ncbi:MAG TPA: PilZ domain-containing protein [Myxococcota bacterium]|nr:PilZ domain-containing protein [Myxococcota bacterium]